MICSQQLIEPLNTRGAEAKRRHERRIRLDDGGRKQRVGIHMGFGGGGAGASVGAEQKSNIGTQTRAARFVEGLVCSEMINGAS